MKFKFEIHQNHCIKFSIVVFEFPSLCKNDIYFKRCVWLNKHVYVLNFFKNNVSLLNILLYLCRAPYLQSQPIREFFFSVVVCMVILSFVPGYL